MKKPIAVLTADVHYSLPTLELADAAMRMAITKARSLQVPLIVAGDTHDTKANLRGECVNRMIDTFAKYANGTQIIFLIGNHDRINEKSEAHSLEFLKTCQLVIGSPMKSKNMLCFIPYNHRLYFVPYNHDIEALRAHLKTIPKGSIVIMHQGLKTANSGEYGDHDKTAITGDDVSGLRVISGHYHARQDIVLPGGGTWSYIGNPYTVNFGESQDPPKGFQILYNDGSLEFVPTNLRKHVIFNLTAKDIGPQTILVYNAEDLLWLKITGMKEEFSRLSRESVISRMNIQAAQVRIDFIIQIDNSSTDSKKDIPTTVEQGLDSVIDSYSNAPNEQKLRLKRIWRGHSEN